LTPEGEKRSFSNINAELWWNFGPYLSAQSNVGLSPYRWDFDVLNFLINAKDRRNDAIQVQYRYTKDNVKEINLDARIKAIAALYLLGSYRYDLLNQYRVASIYGAEYQAQCWSLGLVLENWGESPAGTQKSEKKINFHFTLLNLGAMGHKPYQMNF
jgi:lipopolysaccharide assembly outer membrane protein LptD (OstA)